MHLNASQTRAATLAKGLITLDIDFNGKYTQYMGYSIVTVQAFLNPIIFVYYILYKSQNQVSKEFKMSPRRR